MAAERPGCALDDSTGNKHKETNRDIGHEGMKKSSEAFDHGESDGLEKAESDTDPDAGITTSSGEEQPGAEPLPESEAQSHNDNGSCSSSSPSVQDNSPDSGSTQSPSPSLTSTEPASSSDFPTPSQSSSNYPPPLPLNLGLGNALMRFRPTPRDIISGFAPHVFDERKRRPKQPRRSSLPGWYYYDRKPRASPLRKSIVISWDESQGAYGYKLHGYSRFEVYLGSSKPSSSRPSSSSSTSSTSSNPLSSSSHRTSVIDFGVAWKSPLSPRPSPPKPSTPRVKGFGSGAKAAAKPKKMTSQNLKELELKRSEARSPTGSTSSSSSESEDENEETGKSTKTNDEEAAVTVPEKFRWRDLKVDSGRAFKNLMFKIKSSRSVKAL